MPPPPRDPWLAATSPRHLDLPGKQVVDVRFVLHPLDPGRVAALVGTGWSLRCSRCCSCSGRARPGRDTTKTPATSSPSLGTLIGAWVALDRADTEDRPSGSCPGSQHEALYPDVDEQAGNGGDRLPTDIPSFAGADDPGRVTHWTHADRRQVRTARAPRRARSRHVVFFDGQALHRPQTEAPRDRDGRSCQPLQGPLPFPRGGRASRRRHGQRPPYTRARDYPSRPKSTCHTPGEVRLSRRRRRPGHAGLAQNPEVTNPTGVRKRSLAYAREGFTRAREGGLKTRKLQKKDEQTMLSGSLYLGTHTGSGQGRCQCASVQDTPPVTRGPGPSQGAGDAWRRSSGRRAP